MFLFLSHSGKVANVCDVVHLFMCIKQIGIPCIMISHTHHWMNVMHMSIHTPILVYIEQAQPVSKESYNSQW